MTEYCIIFGTYGTFQTRLAEHAMARILGGPYSFPWHADPSHACDRRLTACQAIYCCFSLYFLSRRHFNTKRNHVVGLWIPDSS